MTRTFGVDASKESANFSAPSHQRELVDSRYHHGWRAMVYFFVHDQNRKSGMSLLARFTFRELALALFVTAIDRRSRRDRVDFHVMSRRYFAAAPRTARQLRG